MRIVMTGATGLVGGLLVQKLGDHDLSLVGRRLVADAPARAVQRIGPMEDWPKLVSQSTYDAAICCLGTTIRVAGSQAAFQAVDRDAVSAFAAAAKAAGARHFLMVSSVGANPATRNFYLRTKGEAEAAVQSIGFERIDIFRPGLLRGHRPGASRPGESFMMAISPFTDLLTPHVFDQYRSIAAESVAAAMAACIGREGNDTRILENRDMLGLIGNR
ncbi:NAD(P)H-binding protein [Aquisediminimonas profunda]|uniref:NAD(P)H-binding protein n=1 Tax=Aquisediminimonas profunda TaxID=1550733 RepID=UPI001C633198|nr:NAD(P)H-binding protein [Aquisediminimonas profunda]